MIQHLEALQFNSKSWNIYVYLFVSLFNPEGHISAKVQNITAYNVFSYFRLLMLKNPKHCTGKYNLLVRQFLLVFFVHLGNDIYKEKCFLKGLNAKFLCTRSLEVCFCYKKL